MLVPVTTQDLVSPQFTHACAREEADNNKHTHNTMKKFFTRVLRPGSYHIDPLDFNLLPEFLIIQFTKELHVAYAGEFRSFATFKGAANNLPYDVKHTNDGIYNLGRHISELPPHPCFDVVALPPPGEKRWNMITDQRFFGLVASTGRRGCGLFSYGLFARPNACSAKLSR